MWIKGKDMVKVNLMADEDLTIDWARAPVAQTQPSRQYSERMYSVANISDNAIPMARTSVKRTN